MKIDGIFGIKPAARLAITIGFVFLLWTCLALTLGLAPHQDKQNVVRRLAMTRSIAVALSTAAEFNRSDEMQTLLERLVYVDPEIKRLTLNVHAGKSMVAQDQSSLASVKGELDLSQTDKVVVGIFSGDRKWGDLRIDFASPNSTVQHWLLSYPNGMLLFIFCGSILACWWVLSRAFRSLNPAKFVPDRVRDALDAITNGLAMLTPNGEIAHANRSFVEMVSGEADRIIGTKIGSFPWHQVDGFGRDLPWIRSLKNRKVVTGEILAAKLNTGSTQKFMVNSTPILDAENIVRGILVSFEDVTALEAKKTELAQTIQKVRQSRDEVERQNEKLFFLANYDPLTKCMNRRSFYSEFEAAWADVGEYPLTALIMDIDYFKSVNDDHGHGVGDAVLVRVGEILLNIFGEIGKVCRYGGEEFTTILNHIPPAQCRKLAEAFRLAVQAEPIKGLSISISIGLADRSSGAMDPQHLLDQADQALYAAKRNGRNQVVCFENLDQFAAHEPKDLSVPATCFSAKREKEDSTAFLGECSYTSVSGLLSALSYRCPTTADHCVRVADLAVELGRPLLSKRDLRLLEIAALMHDIGKIGVPDSILHKPTELTKAEWQIMRNQQKIGASIVRSTFTCSGIVEIVEDYRSGKLEKVRERSMACKVLEVANAFDSMTHPQVFRKAIPIDVSLAEIVKQTPEIYDPAVVQRLVDLVTSGEYSNRILTNFSQNILFRPEMMAMRNNSNLSIFHNVDAQVSGVKPNEEIEDLTKLASEILELGCSKSKGVMGSSLTAQIKNPKRSTK